MKTISKEDLKKLHSVQVEMLLDIDKFCKENDLTYFLIGGTLLGAIRHQGFIPWDDDVDIGMPRESYEKFIQLYPQTDKSKYYVETMENNPQYFHPYAKVRKSHTLAMEECLVNVRNRNEIFVDVFPFDKVLDLNYKRIRIRANIIKAICETMYVKIGMYKIKNCYHKLCSALFLPFSLKTLYKFQKKLMTKDNNKDSKCLVNYASTYNIDKELMEKEIFLPVKKALFEGHKFNIVNNPEYCLTKIYGDYLKLPPKNERVSHNIVSISFDTTNDSK